MAILSARTYAVPTVSQIANIGQLEEEETRICIGIVYV